MNESNSNRNSLVTIYIVPLNVRWGLVSVGEWIKAWVSYFGSFCLCI